jgi:hypothetical protein
MMPSLSRYFTFVGGGLFCLLIGLDALMGRGGPGLSWVPAANPKAPLTGRDSRTQDERLRAEKTTGHVASEEEPRLTQGKISQSAEVMSPILEHKETLSTTAATAPAVGNVEAENKNAKLVQMAAKAEQAKKKRRARERKSVQQVARSRWQDQVYYASARSNIGPFSIRRAEAGPNKLP